jgi:hypothetical protein
VPLCPILPSSRTQRQRGEQSLRELLLLLRVSATIQSSNPPNNPTPPEKNSFKIFNGHISFKKNKKNKLKIKFFFQNTKAL